MNARRIGWLRALAAGTVAMAMLHTAPSRAEMVLSQVIVDLQSGKPARDDVEVWNDGPDRMYVAAEPFEIRSPGLPGEQRVPASDPAASGLLVTPQRMILEPGERRIVRISAVVPRGDQDRIYRVVIRPVAGSVTADMTAIKVLIGYDVLVLYRPQAVAGEVNGTRSEHRLTLYNGSNTAQELFEGKQCDASGGNCRALEATRLYAGATWQLDLPYDTPVEYRLAAGNGSSLKRF